MVGVEALMVIEEVGMAVEVDRVVGIIMRGRWDFPNLCNDFEEQPL